MDEAQRRSLIKRTIHTNSQPPAAEQHRRKEEIRRLKNKVYKLEQQMAQTNAASLVILCEELAELKRNVSAITQALKTNKKFAVLLP